MSQAEEWEAHIAEHETSGLTAKEYCENRNLKLNRFRYWRRKLRPTGTQKTQLQPVIINDSDTEQKNTLLIRVGQATVEVTEGIDQLVLSDVLRILFKYV